MGDLVHRGNLQVKDIPNLDLVNPLLTNDRRQQVVSGRCNVSIVQCSAVIMIHGSLCIPTAVLKVRYIAQAGLIVTKQNLIIEAVPLNDRDCRVTRYSR